MIWKKVKNWKGYEVSDCGEVRSLDRTITVSANGKKHIKTIKGKILSKIDDHKGYYRVHLSNNGVAKNKHTYRLVAEAFIPNPMNLPMVDHIDGNKHNDSVDNLRWVDAKTNKNNPNTRTNGMRKKGEFHHSYETKKKISESQKGRPSPMKGKKLSDEVREKISKGRKGIVAHSQRVMQFTKEGVYIKTWNSISDVYRFLNKPTNTSNITLCCKNLKKSAYGYKWKYENE